MDTVLLNCRKCGAVNRVKKDKLRSVVKCGKCAASIDIPDRPVDATTASFTDEVLNFPGAVLVDFWSPGCGYCLRMNPALEEIASEYTGSLKIVKVNVQDEQSLAAEFAIRGVPALHLYNNGRRINELAGALPKQQLETWIRSNLDM